MSLAGALERAASALEPDADAIRFANGDPDRLAASLDAEAAARVLAWLWSHEPGDGDALASAWSETEEGRERLLALQEDALPKAARKGLRRIRHRLRARGVDVPRAAPTPTVATLPRVEDDLEAALVSPLDPYGARVVYLVEPAPSGGARLFEIVLDPERGITECAVYNAGRSGTRKFLREVQNRSRFAALPVPPVAARRLLARAAGAQPEERPLPRDFSEWRSRLTRTGPDARTPGEMARDALGTEGSVARAVELVREGRIGPWPPGEHVLRPLAERLQGLAAGPLVLSPAQRRERVDQVLGEALGEIYDAARQQGLRERLEESAFVLWKRGLEEEARACLAAARRFGDTAPADEPVARALLEAALAPLLERLRSDEEPPGPEQDDAGQAGSSLIVKP